MNKLTNTKSGSTGEQSIIAKLMRFGLNISKPYWNDDEVDFEVRYGEGDEAVNIPFQVKSVQFKSDKKNVFIQGLKKKYLERNKLLCLSIYNPDTDSFWLLVGNEEIIRSYDNQKSWNNKHIPYKDINLNEDIRLAISSKENSLLKEFKIGLNDHDKVISRINKIAKRKHVTIISEESNDSVDLNSRVKLSICDKVTSNVHSLNTEYIIEGDIVNIITVAHKLFLEFVEQANLERDFISLFRGIFINSIAHRSYETDKPNKIELSTDKIVITNPGALPKELTLEMLKSEHVSVSRNPRLSHDIYKIGLMENLGIGTVYSREIMKSLNEWCLEFKIKDDDFIAVIEKVTKT